MSPESAAPVDDPPRPQRGDELDLSYLEIEEPETA